MSWIERLLRRFVPHKEIGWTEIGETFTRFQLLKTRWGNVYLHKLNAPEMHPHCHDHPWDFVAILLSGGYQETLPEGTFWRRPGRILWRPAQTRHNVVTRGVSWSLIVTGSRKQAWRLIDEDGADCRHMLVPGDSPGDSPSTVAE